MFKMIKLLALAGLVGGFTTYASADTIWNVNASFSYNALGNTAAGTFELAQPKSCDLGYYRCRDEYSGR